MTHHTLPVSHSTQEERIMNQLPENMLYRPPCLIRLLMVFVCWAVSLRIRDDFVELQAMRRPALGFAGVGVTA